MKIAKSGDMVTVRYDGFLANGELFETSQETGPLEFQIGDNTVLAGFNNGVIGMQVGESKEIILSPEEAYGPKRPELIDIFPSSSFAPEMKIEPGLIIGITMEKDGKEHKVPAEIVEINDQGVKLDFNHPLSGQEITYKITLDALEDGEQALEPSPSDNSGDGSD
jgi:FKBP-type peptidyl-prolyl cis-trans isomerase 2